MWEIPFWLYAAVMAASTGANIMAQNKVDSERGKAMREERERRERLTKENEASADKSQKMFSDVQAQQDTRAAELSQQIATPPPPPSGGASQWLDPAGPSAATRTVGDTATTGRVDVGATLANRAKALGRAGSFGSVFQDLGASLGRNAQDIDMNASSMKNWNQRVLPARLEYANQTGREWGTAADVLALAGSIMGPMALSKKPPATTPDPTGVIHEGGHPAPVDAPMSKGNFRSPEPGEIGYKDPWLEWQKFQQSQMPFPFSLLNRGKRQPEFPDYGMH